MKRRYEEYKALREQGKTYREIADAFGITKDAVANYCQSHGLGYSETERQAALSHSKGQLLTDWNGKVEVKYNGTFKLISIGEADSRGERYLIVECLSCGTQKRVSSQSFKGEGGKHGYCEKCNSNRRYTEHKTYTYSPKRIKELKAKEVERQIKKQQEQLKKQKRKIKYKLEHNQIGLRFCSRCELSLAAFGSRLCATCKEDCRKEADRRKETNRRIKEKETRQDKDISLKRLYIRDNGICYLCGRVCDWNDYQIINDAFVVGGSYPSIEHVIALCNGGSHTWDNIKLACHSCNSKKGRKLLAG